MTRRPFIAGNWKMHKTISESVDLASRLKSALAALSERDVAVFPPFTALAAVAKALEGSSIGLGAQNMNDHVQGAYTGEVSPVLLKDAGCAYVILGHSERRQYYGETSALVRKKTQLALEHGLLPIACVGEHLDDREAGRAQSVIETQLRESLAGLTAEEASRVVIAYEPVWAIGTGKTATPAQAEEIHAFIRAWWKGQYGGPSADRLRILYGGSIKPDNIDALMAQPDIDGGLVGGASLVADDFIRIAQFRAGAPARA
jgi:triosephosphate isomerase (TIM)